ncbi:unnamed protein product [Nesidiocoris tenuis]|uniref:Uncharacterized protein n=1 Tax=Nesidiocoris tenuis TaxID=355587 RepID=A0A6H5GJV5_9HEMI|nr:unnamed protein product [Nesidiocoris tenuis]
MAILFALLIFNLELYGSSLMFFFAVPDQSKYYGTSSSSTAATTLPPHLSTDPEIIPKHSNHQLLPLSAGSYSCQKLPGMT